MSAAYHCEVCDYIYSPESGCPEDDIAPGTPWEEVPEDWVCPECGAPKTLFEKAA